MADETIKFPIDRRSPSGEKRRMELEDKKFDTKYNSCCSDSPTDKRLLDYGAKLTISLMTLGFSFYQITRADDCDPLLSVYTSFITLILGVWVGTRADSNKKQ